jgi:hypothetical protein
MANHDLAWTAPQPFWTAQSGSVQDTLAQPQILRFATDDFMPQLLAQLEQDPAALTQYAVYKETWRGPSGPAPAPAQRWLEREPKRLGFARRALLQRKRANGQAIVAGGSDTAPVLKLYQPAHLRHYLVGGSLVCRTPGLPDRAVDPARHKVSFVVRRLVPHGKDLRVPPTTDEDLGVPPENLAGWDEYAFVLQGKAGAWRQVDVESQRVLAGEERLAMFPAPFVQDDGHARRLYIGNVPVGKREAYQGGAAAPPAPPPGSTDAGTPAGMEPRVAMFHMQVLSRWKALANQVMRVTADADLVNARPDALFELPASHIVPPRTALTDKGREVLRLARGPLLTASWYLLLDLREFLDEYLGADFLAGGQPTGSPKRILFDALNGAAFHPDLLAPPTSPSQDPGLANALYPAADVQTNLVSALRAISGAKDGLERVKKSFELKTSSPKPADWPGFLFLFADPWFGPLLPAGTSPTPPADDYLVEKLQARIDHLADLLEDALEAPAEGQRLPEPALASMQPADMREAWYAIRLVYERPECAPFEATVVSAATRPFQMAGFFDPDAPARPIRIGLPVDISPNGLRKFDKNTAFMLSDMLCGQIDRMKGIGFVDLVLSVLPWPFHKDLNVPEKGDCSKGGLSLGVMCSLSIPIVTIAALILLIIIVSLLDFVFRWMPFLVACFPLPGFKGRK